MCSLVKFQNIVLYNLCIIIKKLEFPQSTLKKVDDFN